MPKASANSLYCGNLPFSITEQELRDFFEFAGFPLTRIKLLTDRETGEMRGSGFVDLAEPRMAEAVTALNGQKLGGRALRIREATDSPPPPRRAHTSRDQDLL